MYMAGGEYPDGSASQAFWRYDPVLDVWQEMASMQTPRSELGTYKKSTTLRPRILRIFKVCRLRKG